MGDHLGARIVSDHSGGDAPLVPDCVTLPDMGHPRYKVAPISLNP